MKRQAAALVLFAAAAPAFAHADDTVTPDQFWHHWTFDPLVLVPLFLAHWLYGRGWLRLPRARIGRGGAASFLAGEAVLVAALVSPIDPLGETLLSGHMVQHMLLVAVAPPLLLLGRPAAAFTAALPSGTMAAAARAPAIRPLMRGAVRLTGLVPATILHGVALWAWHVPVAFEAALVDGTLHSLEHFSFFATALLFWMAVFRAGRTARASLFGALAVFVTFLHSGLLGGLLSLAPVPLYPAYGDRPLLWGLDPLTDQQLAGIIMWVPIGPIYLAAALWLVLRVASPPLRTSPGSG